MSSETSYDRHGLDDVCHGNEPLRRRILTEYARTAPAQMSQLLERLAAGDREEAERIAHMLKGSSRTIGAHPLGGLCEEVERGSSDQHAIRDEFERVRLAVESHLESIP